tara:strand:- start:3306 stop:4133 length:828 start_codon:yes stop_codon:yes gene_type:complete
MNLSDLSVVIVTYKSENKIFNCLDSIPDEIQKFVVENSNNIDFKNQIESKYDNTECILTGGNKGYSIGNNIGLKKVRSKYALILNPDTILEKNAIKNFFITVNQISNFWLIGPSNKTNQISSENKIQEVKNLKGFAIFFNLEKFNNTFFDENFFLYFEEIDLCKKVILSGGIIYLVPSISIKHEGGSSVDNNNQRALEKNRNWHWMWSTFYFHKKYKGFFLALLIILPKFISSILKTIFYSFTNNKEKKDIYFCRMSGIFNSILGKKSWYRPSLD